MALKGKKKNEKNELFFAFTDPKGAQRKSSDS
jgi:hypothetical protein